MFLKHNSHRSTFNHSKRLQFPHFSALLQENNYQIGNGVDETASLASPIIRQSYLSNLSFIQNKELLIHCEENAHAQG